MPNILKRRYLDYLDKLHVDMSQPGFDSLRDFVVPEIKIMTSHCAQTFFKQDDKDGSSDPLANKNFQVHRVTLSWRIAFIMRNPLRFQWHNLVIGAAWPECRHFLIDCEKFMAFLPVDKRQCVVDAKRCLNCLSLNHFVRDCKGPL